MRLLHDERGMTLTELIASIFVAMIVFGAAVTTFVEFLDVSSRSDNQTRAQDTARQTVDRLTGQLRNAMSAGTTSSSPIESFSSFDVVFLAPIPSAVTTNNPRGLYHIRYCIGNANNKDDTLWYQTQAYNSSTQTTHPSITKCPSNTWATQTAVADKIVNLQTAGQPALFSRTIDTNTDTTHVAVRAIVDWNVNKDPKSTQLLTNVSLRNVNRKPVASASCNGLANGHIICDASASTDPDGQTISYAWSVDGATLSGETTYRLDKAGYGAGTNHTVVLTVTDPGGSTATATYSVRIP